MGKGIPGRNLEWHLQNNHLYSAHICPQQYYTDSPWKGKEQDIEQCFITQHGFTIITAYLLREYVLFLPHNQAFIAKTAFTIRIEQFQSIF